MTLDEAIKREEKNEKQQIERANALDDIPLFGMTKDDKKQIEDCYKRAEEHRQIAEWLKELKENKDVLNKIKAEIDLLSDSTCDGTAVTIYSWNGMKRKVFDIIDKYRKRGE